MSGRHRAPESGARPALPVGRVLVAVTAIVVVVVGAAFYVVTRDVDLPSVPGRSAATPPPDGSGTDGTDDSGASSTTAPVSVPERYAALAADLPPGRGCRPDREASAQAARRTGVADRQVCPLPDGELELTTYTDETAFEATRSGALDRRVGSLVAGRGRVAYASLDPAVASGGSAALVYWDDREALQSARLTGRDGTTLRALERQQASLRPSVRRPRQPSDRDLVELATVFSLNGCTPVPVSYPGAVEEVTCRTRGVDARAGSFGDRASFRSFQERLRGRVEADPAGFDDFWFHDLNGRRGRQRDEPQQGTVYGFAVSSGGVLFLDHAACRCYVQLLSSDLDARGLYDKLF